MLLLNRMGKLTEYKFDPATTTNTITHANICRTNFFFEVKHYVELYMELVTSVCRFV